MADSVVVKCPNCGAKNRIPVSRWGDPKAVCGRCKTHLDTSSLYPDRPIFIKDGTFKREILQFPGAVMLEFFSPR